MQKCMYAYVSVFLADDQGFEGSDRDPGSASGEPVVVGALGEPFCALGEGLCWQKTRAGLIISIILFVLLETRD